MSSLDITVSEKYKQAIFMQNAFTKLKQYESTLGLFTLLRSEYNDYRKLF